MKGCGLQPAERESERGEFNRNLDLNPLVSMSVCVQATHTINKLKILVHPPPQNKKNNIQQKKETIKAGKKNLVLFPKFKKMSVITASLLSIFLFSLVFQFSATKTKKNICFTKKWFLVDRNQCM